MKFQWLESVELLKLKKPAWKIKGKELEIFDFELTALVICWLMCYLPAKIIHLMGFQ